MNKPKGTNDGSFKGIAKTDPRKVEGGYQGPRGGLGTPPTGSGGGSGGGSKSGSKK
jgi:hypothetical protein